MSNGLIIINNLRTVVLSPESGVVTVVYIWDSVSREAVHERTPGALTIACRKEKDGWKIVHYHGSHDDPEVITDYILGLSSGNEY